MSLGLRNKLGRRRLRSASESQAYHAGRLAQERAWDGHGAVANPYPKDSLEAAAFDHGAHDIRAENS